MCSHKVSDADQLSQKLDDISFVCQEMTRAIIKGCASADGNSHCPIHSGLQVLKEDVALIESMLKGR